MITTAFKDLFGQSVFIRFYYTYMSARISLSFRCRTKVARFFHVPSAVFSRRQFSQYFPSPLLPFSHSTPYSDNGILFTIKLCPIVIYAHHELPRPWFQNHELLLRGYTNWRPWSGYKPELSQRSPTRTYFPGNFYISVIGSCDKCIRFHVFVVWCLLSRMYFI